MDVDRTRNMTFDEVGISKEKKEIEIYHSDYFYGLNMDAIILKFPTKNKMDNMNKYFMEIANLVQEGTNILSFGFDKNGNNNIVTHKQLALYLDVVDKTVYNLLYEYGKLGIIARIKVNDIQYFVMNPDYAIHRNGINSFVYNLFNINIDSVDDTVNKVKKNFIVSKAKKQRFLLDE